MQLSVSIKTTRINLSSLSKNDVTNMLMTEFRLPRRIVAELAHVVHKKTAGHALFIVELLNSLLRESTISYSSEKRRYSWDSFRIDRLQTGDSVAELIASNLSSLSPTFQRMLRILSCFGTQTNSTLLGILENLQNGIFPSIDFFIDRGILDRAGPIVIFTHDLIQQVVYESMDLDHRSALHLEIGEYLGGQSRIDESIALTGMGQLQLKEQEFYSGRNLASHLVCIACDQIGTAGPNLSSEIRRMKFAEWFLSAGLTTSKRFHFRAAHYYYVKGIEFLGEDSWILDLQLCTEL
jgi:predicted ATPase